MPSAVNLPLLAEDVTFDISIKRSAPEDRLRPAKSGTGDTRSKDLKLVNHLLYRVLRRAAKMTGENIPLFYIALFLPPAPVVVDAGAHNGSETVQMSLLWPQGTVHAFEPVPAVFRQLEANTSRCPNVRRYPVALAGVNAGLTMHVSSGGTDASSSLLTPKEHLAINPHVAFEEQITVSALTLDTWAEQNHCAGVDLLWLDMQGGELAALQAAPQILVTVQAIHLEAATVELYADNPLYPEVRAWLEAQGFQVEIEALAHASGGNAFFVRQGTRLSLSRLLALTARKLSRKLGRR